MKIRLGILDSNVFYIKRLIEYFSSHYAEEVEIFAFSNSDKLADHLSQAKLDVILSDEELLPEDFSISRSTVLAYLSDSMDIKTIRDLPAVCKYQKAEQLYRDVLNLYAELDRRTSYRMSDHVCPVLLFMGVSGGAGTTTVAAACALNLTNIGFKVLYLNLEDNGVISDIFSDEGQMTLSDVLYSIKSNHQNLALKLESMVRKDRSGVFFYEPFAVTLDANEMTDSDLKELLTSITQYGLFDFIIVDTGAAISRKRDLLIQFASRVFLVGEGSAVSNKKLRRILQELEIKEEHEEERVLAKTSVIYNKFGRFKAFASTEYGEDVFAVIDDGMKNNRREIMNDIANDNCFGNLIAR